MCDPKQCWAKKKNQKSEYIQVKAKLVSHICQSLLPFPSIVPPNYQFLLTFYLHLLHLIPPLIFVKNFYLQTYETSFIDF